MTVYFVGRATPASAHDPPCAYGTSGFSQAPTVSPVQEQNG